MRRAALLVVVLPFVAACSRSTSDVKVEDGYNLASYHKVAVPAFMDGHGQGAEIAKDVRDILANLPKGVCDEAIVDKVLSASQNQEAGADGTLGLEALERLRFQAGADAIVLGRMSPDWSSASVLVYETELGDGMLTAIVHPPKGQKVFSSPEEIAGAVVAVLAHPR